MLTSCRFRIETEDDSLQPTIDMLLNFSIFMWYGAICPWVDFRVNDVIPIWRLIILGVLILLFRRLPFVLLVWRHVHQIEDWQQAFFVGFFGPIGVSAIFYLYISLDFLHQISYEGHERLDAQRLADVIYVVVWFLAICSVVVHGLSIPLGKLSYHLPRTISSRIATSSSQNRTDMRLNGLTNRLAGKARDDPNLKKNAGASALRQRRDAGTTPEQTTLQISQPVASRRESRTADGRHESVHVMTGGPDEPSRPIKIFASEQSSRAASPDSSCGNEREHDMRASGSEKP